MASPFPRLMLLARYEAMLSDQSQDWKIVLPMRLSKNGNVVAELSITVGW